jgi:hypothetical protein
LRQTDTWIPGMPVHRNARAPECPSTGMPVHRGSPRTGMPCTPGGPCTAATRTPRWSAMRALANGSEASPGRDRPSDRSATTARRTRATAFHLPCCGSRRRLVAVSRETRSEHSGLLGSTQTRAPLGSGARTHAICRSGQSIHVEGVRRSDGAGTCGRTTHLSALRPTAIRYRSTPS